MKNLIKSAFMVLLLLFAVVPTYAVTYPGDNSDSLFEPIAAFLEEGENQVFTISRLNGDIQKVDLEVLVIEDTELPAVIFAVNGMQIAPLTEGDSKSISHGLRLMVYQINVGKEKAGNPDGVEFSIEMDGSVQSIAYEPLPVAIDDAQFIVDDLVQKLQRQKDELRNTAFWMSVGDEKTLYPSDDVTVKINYLGNEKVRKDFGEQSCELFDVHYIGPSYEGPSYKEAVGGVRSTLTQAPAAVLVEEQFAEEVVPIYGVHEDILVNEDNIKNILEPTDSVRAILGDDIVDEVVDALIQPIPKEELSTKDLERVEVLAAKLFALADKVDGKEWIDFVADDDKVIDSLEDLLVREKGLRRNNQDNHKKFREQNGLDKKYEEMFNDLVKKARLNMKYAQIHGYKSWMTLLQNNVDEAEKEYAIAMDYYNEHRKWFEKADAEIKSWKPLVRSKNGFIYIDSYGPTNAFANTQGFVYVDEGQKVTFSAVIDSATDQENVPWTLYNNGYPDGKGATKTREGKIDLKKGKNTLDGMSMDFFYHEDTLYNTGSFITVLRVGKEAYHGSTLYVSQSGGDRKTIPVDREEWTESLCLREDDLGFSVFLYERKDNEVLVAFNPFNHGFVDGPYPEIWDGINVHDETGDYVITKIMKPTVGAKVDADAQGCRVNGNTMPIGTRYIETKGNKEVAKYCHYTGETREQQPDGADSSNGYSCLSGEESGGVCINTLSWLQKIFSWILG